LALLDGTCGGEAGEGCEDEGGELHFALLVVEGGGLRLRLNVV
jgi:hypothetical protein